MTTLVLTMVSLLAQRPALREASTAYAYKKIHDVRVEYVLGVAFVLHTSSTTILKLDIRV